MVTMDSVIAGRGQVGQGELTSESLIIMLACADEALRFAIRDVCGGRANAILITF